MSRSLCRRTALGLCALSSLAAAGCQAVLQAAAESAVDSTDVGSVESALMASASEGADGLTADEAAMNAEAMAPAQFDPSCLTVTRSGTTVTYVLVECTGPYGLLTVSGTVVVVFSDSAAGLVADLTSDGLDVNGGIYDVAATALITSSGTGRTLEVSATTTGTTPRGRALERTGDYVVTVEDTARCVTLNGAWETVVDGDGGWDTDVANVRKCEGACPDAGGTVVFTGRRRGNTVTVSFDGTNLAPRESSTGRTGTVELACL